MTPNFTAPKNLQDKYNLQWETEALKYLGITATKEISKLSHVSHLDKSRYQYMQSYPLSESKFRDCIFLFFIFCTLSTQKINIVCLFNHFK